MHQEEFQGYSQCALATSTPNQDSQFYNWDNGGPGTCLRLPNIGRISLEHRLSPLHHTKYIWRS